MDVLIKVAVKMNVVMDVAIYIVLQWVSVLLWMGIGVVVNIIS